MRAFIRFHRGILEMPLPWQLWLVLLVSTNLVAPIFFIEHVEARVVVGALLISVALMTYLTARFGFTRILGLGHVAWIPLIAFLSTRLSDIPADGAFGLWLRAVIALDAASLVIDTIDVARFVRGEREETVSSLAVEKV